MSFWIRTNTNRLKQPFKKIPDTEIDISGTTVNWCGQPVAKVGDYVHVSGSVSAFTVGRIVKLEDFGGNISGGAPNEWWSARFETLDGKENTAWLWSVTVLPYNAVQEVKDFYTNDGRPSRIKVNW